MSDRIWGSPIGVRILSEQTIWIAKAPKRYSREGLPLIPQSRKRVKIMSEFIFFMIGLMLGGLVGIVIMCLLQVNRLHDEICERNEVNESKKYSEDYPS